MSLRRAEAANIEVVSLEEGAHPDNIYHGTLEEHVAHEADELSKQITVALVGNPNCGKTSFFNHATGLREKVGNYSGVTVDAKTGVFTHRGYTINLVDLPGIYSLTEYTPEELYVRDFIAKQQPDVVLNIVDARQFGAQSLSHHATHRPEPTHGDGAEHVRRTRKIGR